MRKSVFSMWNILYVVRLSPCPHFPLFFPSLHASSRKQAYILQRGREEERWQERWQEVLILGNWAAILSQVTRRRLRIKYILFFSCCYDGPDSLQSPNSHKAKLSSSVYCAWKIKYTVFLGFWVRTWWKFLCMVVEKQRLTECFLDFFKCW